MLAEQAVETVIASPPNPSSAFTASARLDGATRLASALSIGACGSSTHAATSASISCDSPLVVPMTLEQRSGSSSAGPPASSKASLAAEAASRELRPHSDSSSAVSIARGSKSTTSPAFTYGNPVVSKLRIGPVPTRPSSIPRLKASRPIPMLETGPSPETTTESFNMVTWSRRG